MIYICIYQNLVTAALITPLHRCTAVCQVFTRSLRVHSVPIASILLLSHRYISHRCKSGIYALTLSMPIASILLLPHRCIIDRSTSGIHALTLSQLHQSCHRRIAALPNRCMLGIHALTLSQLHQSCHRRTAASLHRCTLGIHALTPSQLHQSFHRRTAILLTAVRQVFTRSLRPNYINLVTATPLRCTALLSRCTAIPFHRRTLNG